MQEMPGLLEKVIPEQAEARTDQANMRAEQAETSEQALGGTELGYRRLFETAKDGILILDSGTTCAASF